MSENTGWKPMTQEETERHNAMPVQEFFVGADGRPATTEKAAKRSLEAANAMEPHDVTDYLRALLEDDESSYTPLDFNEKFDLKREIGLLTVIPKQELPNAFKRISTMLDKYSNRVKNPAKLDQVRHYLNNFGQTDSET